MEASDNCLDLIRHFEGLRLDSYCCPGGIWTIGYGHTGGIMPGQSISREYAEQLLAEDVAKFAEQVELLLKRPVTQQQFDSLVSLAFNIGITALASSTLIRMLNEGRDDDAVLQFSRWMQAGGKILPGLVARRRAEADIFRGEAIKEKDNEMDDTGAARA